MSDKLAIWNRWRDRVAGHCVGNWERIAINNCNNDAIHTLLGNKNISCPECGRSEKLFLADPLKLSAHCCAASCNKHYFDGVATIAALDGISQSDVLKRIAENENIDNEPDPDFQSRKSSFKNHLSEKTVQKTPPAKPKVNQWATKEREYLLSNMSQVSDAQNIVFKYLEKRGLNTEVIQTSILNNLWFIDGLDYYKKVLDNNDIVVDIEKGNYPAMVAKVLDCNFNLVGFHKTYLSMDGKKAQISTPKQLASSLYKGQYSENGAIIPLCKPNNGRYGIAEGLETSLAILAMNRPCWSVLNANGVKSFIVPADCKILDIYGDLDASGTGQLVMIEKYGQLLEERPDIKVNLYLPPESHWNYDDNPKGIDFLDSYKVNVKTLPALGGFSC